MLLKVKIWTVVDKISKINSSKKKRWKIYLNQQKKNKVKKIEN